MDFALALSPIHHPSGLQKDFRVGKSVLSRDLAFDYRSVKLDFETETLSKFPTKGSLIIIFFLKFVKEARNAPVLIKVSN